EQAVVSSVNGAIAESSATDSAVETATEEGSSSQAAPTEAEHEAEAVASSSSNDGMDIDNRTFTVTNLKHPGAWRTHPEIINMLARCESFSIRFERATKQKGPKPGHISFTFESISSAREAFTQAQKMRVDGHAVKVEACPAFFAPAACKSRPFFKPPVDEEVRKRTIYALDLPTTAEQNLLNSIFESDHIERITFLPLRSEHKQAEVIMHTEEQADAARSEDGFELDDGKQQSVLRILTPVDYAAFVAEEQKPVPFVPPKVEEVPTPSSTAPSVSRSPSAKPPDEVKLAPVLDEDDVTDMFIKYVTEQRVNWAEVTDVMELYTMCDAVSAQIGGLPDSVLRPAMLHTLQRHLTEAQSAWMREHLQDLIKWWKQEVKNDAFVDRPTLVQMKAAEYVPIAPSKRKYRGKNSAESRAGRVMMGVGAFLEAQRSKMVTEEGELEVEEDDEGNILLGGEALSFESWAKLTKTNQPDIVHANMGEDGPPAKKPREIHDFKKFKQSQKEWREKKMAAKKMRIMKEAREGVEALDKAKAGEAQTPKDVENGKDKKDGATPEKISKPPKELDEGEIDSEEERKEEKEKRRRRKASSSSNSSSSSSSSESEDDGDARKRRRNRRKTERLKGPQVPPLFQRMFNHRHVIINALSAEHKTAFASVLHQVGHHCHKSTFYLRLRVVAVLKLAMI
ncbi:unnamed protein product, partial [Cylicostephanus goldi]